MQGTSSKVSSWRAKWPGYAACAWALLFAVMSFYWAAGGTAGAETLGEAITGPALARDPGFVALLWVTGVLKALGGLVALALVQPWDHAAPRWVLLTAAWAGGALAALYGGASMIQHGLMVASVIPIPTGLGATAARWHLFFWDPWWLTGGLLFLVAGWYYFRRS